MIIARHFNAGLSLRSQMGSPGGTTDIIRNEIMANAETMCRSFNRPCGTHAGADKFPALKRRAIVGLSLPGRAQADWSRAPQSEIRNSKWSGLLFRFSFWDGRLGHLTFGRPGDAMTIARHFNAGLNPQNIPSPGGTTGFSKMKSCSKCGDDLSFVQPSRWDWWPCASTPALKRRAIVGLSRWDERGRTGRALRNS